MIVYRKLQLKGLISQSVCRTKIQININHMGLSRAVNPTLPKLGSSTDTLICKNTPISPYSLLPKVLGHLPLHTHEL